MRVGFDRDPDNGRMLPVYRCSVLIVVRPKAGQSQNTTICIACAVPRSITPAVPAQFNAGADPRLYYCYLLLASCFSRSPLQLQKRYLRCVKKFATGFVGGDASEDRSEICLGRFDDFRDCVMVSVAYLLSCSIHSCSTYLSGRSGVMRFCHQVSRLGLEWSRLA